MPISVSEWVKENQRTYKKHGLKAVPRSAYYAYLGLWFSVISRFPTGENVFEKDWDILLLLDACRVDALEAVAEEYSFINNVGSILSVGSSSEEWLANTFTTEYQETVNDTAYLSANGFTEELLVQEKEPPSRQYVPFSFSDWNIVGADSFGMLDQVWEYGVDNHLHQVPPRILTDRTIQVGRETNLDRIITHYLQPHEPYTARAHWEGREPVEAEVNWRAAYNRGELSGEQVWNLYLDNLRFVLDDVELLLENINAEKVAISADHGELLGEWRTHGHPSGIPHPKVRRVPWVETTATDRRTHRPETIDREPSTEVEEHLEALGYK